MNSILAMWTPGPIELVVILIIIVLIFGKRLPEIARSAGKSLNEFKKGLKEISNVEEDETINKVTDNKEKTEEKAETINNATENTGNKEEK